MYLLFDIGATKTRVAFSPDGKTIEENNIYPTPLNYAEALLQFEKMAEHAIAGRKLVAAAGGIAGSVTREGKLNVAPYLKWSDVELKTDLVKILKVPVELHNDTALGGLGEALYGAGKEYKIVVFITISTGVNGVRIVDGLIDKSVNGFEIGPHIINQLSDGKLITFGQSVSGSTLEKKYNKMPSQIEDDEVWEEVAKNIAIGVHNANAFWSPDIVVLGGGVMQNKKLSIEKIKKYMSDIPNLSVPLRVPHPMLVKSKMRDEVGLWGALECAKICGL